MFKMGNKMKRIMVVDDEPEIVKIIKIALEIGKFLILCCPE
jgi:CheY-like chemotaxis protein